MNDAIIIGSGPAGVTAAIYAARREMKILLIGKEPGGQLNLASEIENYPGFKEISAFELVQKMSEQVKNLGVEIKTEEVQKIEEKDGYFLIITNRGQYETKTIIIAMGVSPRRLAIPGEEKLTGHGVSYCANCDGPLYRGKIVAVIGGGNAALDAAEMLSKIASQVYLIHRRDEFRGFESLVAEIKTRENIIMVLNSQVEEIIGEDKVEKIIVMDNSSQKKNELLVNGVFIEVGRIASTDLVADLVKRDDKAQIIVDEKCQTSRSGIFAAGDVTQVEFKQITIACGQGTIAALTAYQYLQAGQGKDKILFDRGHKSVK